MNDSSRYIITLSLLSAFGLAGNHFNITLFFGVDFIFGSVAVLAAVNLLGMRGAVITALISGSYTYILWEHPYALIIFTAEAIVVSFLLSRRINNLTIADIIFWVVIGMPLIWLFYGYTMGMGATQVNLIMFKQPVNGIVNAILATYLLYLMLARFRLPTHIANARIRLREAIFTLLVTFALLSTLITIIYQNTIYRGHHESTLKDLLELQSRHLEPEIKQALETHTLKQNIGALLQHELPNGARQEIIVTSKNQDILGTTLPIEVAQSIVTNTRLSHITGKNLYLFTPDKNNQPKMLKWQESMFYTRSTHDQYPFFNIYILQYSNSIANILQRNIQNAFLILFIVIIIASITAYFICHILTNTITRLTQVTKDLPDKLQQHEKIQWPESRIYEIEQLTHQTQIMSRNISDSLDDASARSKAIIESSIDAIVTTDDKGIIQGFNRAAELQFSYPGADVIGRHVRILLPVTQHAALDDYFANPENKTVTPASTRYLAQGQRRDGSTFPIEASVTRITLHGQKMFTAIITDITERRASEKLKREFISTVSHELRTPLTSIKGSVNLLLSKGRSMPAEKTTSLLDITSRNVERLSDLINDILDFDKLESGRFDYELEVVDTSRILTELIEETLPIATQANIVLLYECQPGYFINIDPKRFLQILRNLVSNAIKFSAKNTNVSIKCECIDNSIKISIQDQGIGISENFSKKIFNRFSQADSSDTRKIQRGTGLGLAISKRMVEDMGGTIGFNSIEGKGSTFYLVFPIAG